MSNIFNTKKDKVKTFKKVTRDKTKKEIRKAEEQILTPEPIEHYHGELPEIYGIDALTVSIVFPDEHIKKLFGEFLKISYSKVKKQQYVTDISLIINLVKQLHAGTLVYEDGKFQTVTRQNAKKGKRRKLI